MLSDTKISEIQANTSTRAEVIERWGPPTTTSAFDNNTWYYIGETTSQRGIFAPEVDKRRMVRLKFDPANNDVVTEITELDPTQGREIDLVDRKTPTAGKEFTAVQQFLGNLGKYNNPSAKK
jgi:outer membrane protein assembly factor BamE (lipoprotein component of BamABCDE complex)